MSVGGGSNLGAARGSIDIDTSGLGRVQATARSVGQDVQRSLGGISTGAARAEQSFSSLRGSAVGVAGVLGVSFGAAGALQLARYALSADAVATSYKRQNIAAVNLAGGQEKLNSLLTTYDKVTGGAVNKATALNDVTRLQAVGFADTTAELERFVTAARGISVATGQQQDYVISQLQLAIANQSTMRLDQLGLGVSEVQTRIEALQAADKNLTKEMAYQNAILGLAEEKFGALAKSTEAQATGAEKAAKATADLKLAFGDLVDEPVGEVMGGLATQLNLVSQGFEDITGFVEDLKKEMGGLSGVQVPAWFWALASLTNPALGANRAAMMALSGLHTMLNPDSGARTGIGTNVREGVFASPVAAARARQSMQTGGVGGPWMAGAATEDQIAVISDHYAAVRDLEKQSARARLDETRQYEEQRSDAIRQYEQGIAREAEDFARTRQRQAQQLEEDIADVREEAGRREAEAREDSARRLAEAEEDYQRQREQAMEDHEDRLRDAASNLDAKAIYEEQRRFTKEQERAKEAHDERVDDERDALDERLAEAREADERRIEELRQNLADQQALEDEDRRIRLERQAQDHQAQLEQMAVEHQNRLEQIAQQGAEERAALQEQFNQALADAGLRNERWLKEQEKAKDEAMKLFEEFWRSITQRMGGGVNTRGDAGRPGFAAPTAFAQGGPVLSGGLALLHAGEFVMPAPAVRGASGGGSGPLTLNASIVINESARPGQTAAEIRQMLIDLVREAA